jgi:Succinylglutamate desuccinylase / Aspartoacylase family
MNPRASATIGTPGQAWSPSDIAQWRSMQVRQRSYAQEVLAKMDALPGGFEMQTYGELVYASERFPLVALKSRDWRAECPSALITGGVHGYETSGVQGVLRFLQTQAQEFAGRVNLLLVPCVSPWAFERVQRWNFDALDPNRHFRQGSAVQECAALMRLIAPLRGQWAMHIDLHETTDTDESEFRPALAARDGQVFEPGSIPDGFYVVDDSGNPQPAFQQAILEAVERVTHLAPIDENGEIIGSPAISRGVIHYDMQGLGLCASISGARYTCTTEVYPDSPRTTPEQCLAAQVTAVCAGLDFLIKNGL